MNTNHCFRMAKPANSFNLNKAINGESQAGPSSHSSIVLREVVRQDMKEITRNSGNRNGNAVAEGCTIEQFNKIHSLTFEGKADPFAAEDWIQHIKNVPWVLRCTKEQKVLYSMFKLVGEAKRWWIVERTLQEAALGQASLTWGRLKKILYAQLFS